MEATIQQAVRFLAGQDEDHATELNGRGFNGTDTGPGHRLAGIPDSEWTKGELLAGWDMTRKYRAQLEGAGFDVDAIAKPAAAKADKRALAFRLVDGEVIAQFPYDPELLGSLKQAFHPRWNPEAKVWSIPANRYNLIEEFAMDFGFEITAAVQALIAAPAPAPVAPAPQTECTPRMLGTIDRSGDFIVLKTAYSPELVGAIKDRMWPREWQAASKTWRAIANEGNLEAAWSIALEFGLQVTPDFLANEAPVELVG